LVRKKKRKEMDRKKKRYSESSEFLIFIAI